MQSLGVMTSAAAAASLLLAAGCGGAPTSSPQPTSVTPDRGLVSLPAAVVIAGRDFAANVTTDFTHGDPSTLDARFQAFLGATPLLDVRLHADGTLSATVPAGLQAGLHDLTVVDPVGRSGTLPGAYRGLSAADVAGLVASYRFDAIGPQQAWSPFTVTITAIDAAGGAVADFNGAVALSDLTATAVPGSPARFRSGVWTGAVEVRAPHAADVLAVVDALGKRGTSAPFPVAPTPAAALRFSTPARSAVAGQCSGPGQPLTVELADAFGLPTVAAGAIALAPTLDPGLELFADAACTVPAASPAFPAGSGSLTLWFRSTRAGSATVTLSATSLGGASQVETIAAGTPARIAFVTPPRTVVAGSCSPASTLEVRDAWDNPALGSATTLALTASPSAGFGFFSDSACTVAAATIATATATARADLWFRGTVAQPVTVSASGAGLAAASQLETVTSGAADRLAFTTAARTATAGGCSGVVTVELRDPLGNVGAATASVPLGLLGAPAAGTTFYADPGCTIPLAAGEPAIVPGGSGASFHFAATAAGTLRVTVSATGLTSASQDETIVPALPAAIAFTTAPQSVPAGSCSAVTGLETRDAFGNVATAGSAVAVALAATPSAGFAFFGDAGCVTPVSGATFAAGASAASFWFRGTVTGSVRVDATAPGLAGASQAETISPAAADRLAFTTAPQSVAAGACSAAVTVQSRDALGNASAVPAATTVTLSASPPAGFAFFSDATCATATNSVTLAASSSQATFWLKGTVAQGVTVDAAATGLGGASQAETITPAPADRLAFTTSPQTVTAGGCSAATGLATRDAWGNASSVAAPTRIDLTAAPAGGFGFYSDASCSTPVASLSVGAGGGSATFHFRGTAAGSVAVTATVAGWTPVSQGETLVGGAATQLRWDAIPTPEMADRAFSVRLAALDAWGNLDTAFAGTATLSLTVNPAIAPAPTLACAAGCSGLTTGSFASGAWTGRVAISGPASPDAASPDHWLVATSALPSATSNGFAVVGLPVRSPPTARVTAAPGAARTGQAVLFDSSGSSDYQTATADLLVSWDFTGTATAAPGWPTAGAPWTGWTTLKTASNTFSTAGRKAVRVAVRDADGDVGFGTVTVLAYGGGGDTICVVDTDVDVDDGATSCVGGAAGFGADGKLSFPEAMRLLAQDGTITFASPMTIRGSGTWSLPRRMTIHGYGVVFANKTFSVSQGTGANPVRFIGAELTGQTAPVTINAGFNAVFEDVWFHDSAGIETWTGTRLDRVRMERCTGACVTIRDTSSSGYLTVRASAFRGSGSGTAIQGLNADGGPPTADVATSLFTGFQLAILLPTNGATTIVNDTFEANGTAIEYRGSGGHVLRNNVFSNQGVAAVTVGTGTTFTSRDHHQLWQNASDGPLATDANVLASDPRYLFPAVGDYRLSLGSPAVDSGVDTGLNLLPAFPSSTPRFLGAGPDRGGYETW